MVANVLAGICDFNHNYLGCSSITTDAFLTIDKAVIVIYSLVGAYCVYLYFKKTNSSKIKAVLILTLLILTGMFKIAYLLLIPVSFPASIFLHFLFYLTHQLPLVVNFVKPKIIEKQVSLAMILRPKTQRQKVAITLMGYILTTSLGIVTLSNNVSIFLFALDSTNLEKYHIYHFIQFIANPFFYSIVLSPILFLIKWYWVKYGHLLPSTSSPVNSDGNDVANPRKDLETAVVDLFDFETIAVVLLNLASITMVLEIVGLNIPVDKVIYVKIISEIFCMTSNLVHISRLGKDGLVTNTTAIVEEKSTASESAASPLSPGVVVIRPNQEASMPTVILNGSSQIRNLISSKGENK